MHSNCRHSPDSLLERTPFPQRLCQYTPDTRKALLDRGLIGLPQLAVLMERNIDREWITVNESLSHDFRVRHAAIQRFVGNEKRRVTSAGGGAD